MAKRPDDRVQWTLKAREFDAEFMNLVRMAAARQGQTITAFVADTLRERSQAILKDEAPAHPPPARLEDVAGTLAEMITTMAATQEQRLALAEQRLAATVERLVPPRDVPAREARRLRMALRRR